jgi:hypothetical protein
MNPHLAEALVRSHQHELMATAERHRGRAAVRATRPALRMRRLLLPRRRSAAPCYP